MATDLKITDQFRIKHETMWQNAIQQEASRLEPYVTIKSGAGNGVEIPYLGKTELREYTEMFAKVEWTHLPTGKRTIRRRMFTNTIPISSDANINLHDLSLKVSDVMAEQRKAYGRKIDEVILGTMIDATSGKYRIRTQADGVCGGFFSENYTGNEGATLVPLDISKGSPNLIPANLNASTAAATDDDKPLVLAKMAYLRMLLMQRDAWTAGNGDDIVFAISPVQYFDMLHWEEMQRKDYGFQCLRDGKVNDFLGMKVLITNMLPVDEKGNRLCAAWLRSRLAFAPWTSSECRVEPRADYVNVRQQVTFVASCGATRLDDSTCFAIPCKEPTIA